MTDHRQAASSAAAAGIGVSVAKGLRGAGHFEPSLATRFLPRCAACGHPHPRASAPPSDAPHCPKCGVPVAAAGPIVEIPAAITGRSPTALLARGLLAAGRFCANLRKGIG